MTDLELASWVIDIVRSIQSSAERAMVRAQADLAGRRASHKVWDEANPDDGVGGMSCNPYQERESDIVNVKRLEQKAIDAKELTDFTINRVLRELADITQSRQLEGGGITK